MNDLTMWERISDALISHNINVYPPATKTGDCTDKYVVIKPDGSSQIENYSSEVHYYSALIYVPEEEFTELEKFKKEVKEIFAADLYPMIMPTGQEQPYFFDNSNNAHTCSIMYRVNMQNKQL